MGILPVSAKLIRLTAQDNFKAMMDYFRISIYGILFFHKKKPIPYNKMIILAFLFYGIQRIM